MKLTFSSNTLVERRLQNYFRENEATSYIYTVCTLHLCYSWLQLIYWQQYRHVFAKKGFDVFWLTVYLHMCWVGREYIYCQESPLQTAFLDGDTAYN